MEINIVNVSGGVDSTACYLLALERGIPFRAVFADTGNEHEITLDYVRNLAHVTGGPELQIVKADFAQRIEAKRMRLEMMRDSGQYKEGWDAEKVERVLDNLHATGVPFIDMVLYNGRFPAGAKRFCTVELKLDAIKRQATIPAIAEAIQAGGRATDVIHWVGIRRDESRARANAEEWEIDHAGNRVYRPLVEWTKQQCFELLAKHGVEPNPLYKMGCSRVGCMPCIMSRKCDIREIAARWPEHIDKIREWERLASLCSRNALTTFFESKKTPGTAVDRSNVDAVVEWAKTGRGGMQYSMDALFEPPACSSLYGLCE